MISDSLKQSYLRRKKRLEKVFLTDLDCHRYLREHSSLVDAMLETILESRSRGPELAVFATGGYGRRELFPSSDLDVLFVFDGKDTAAEPIISSVLHELWDTGLDIGHQVWSLQELGDLSLNQYQFIIALLDSRPVGPDSDLRSYFRSKLLPEFFAANGEFLAAKIIEITRSRHHEFDNTLYQLEPDLKLAPGGLRDLQVGRWLSRLDGSHHFLPYSEEEIEKKREKKETIKFKLKLLNLETGKEELFEDISSFEFNKKANHIVMVTYPPDGSKTKGKDIILRNLDNRKTRNIGNVIFPTSLFFYFLFL